MSTRHSPQASSPQDAAPSRSSTPARSSNGASPRERLPLIPPLHTDLVFLASLTVADLAGTWKYSAPACKFESSDFLKSAGGEVVAASLKTKLATYYTKAGITPSRVSFAFADTTFVMKYGNAKLNGHIVKDEESGRFVVTFTAVGGYLPIMVMDAVINKNGNTLEILFDVDRFVKVLTTIASKSQSSTLKSVGGLLDEYDGILMGFELNK